MSNSGSEHSVNDAKRWISAVLLLYSNELVTGSCANLIQRDEKAVCSAQRSFMLIRVPRDCSAYIENAFRVNGKRIEMSE
jgi:hypothetical protein